MIMLARASSMHHQPKRPTRRKFPAPPSMHIAAALLQENCRIVSLFEANIDSLLARLDRQYLTLGSLIKDKLSVIKMFNPPLLTPRS